MNSSFLTSSLRNKTIIETGFKTDVYQISRDVTQRQSGEIMTSVPTGHLRVNTDTNPTGHIRGKTDTNPNSEKRYCQNGDQIHDLVTTGCALKAWSYRRH